MQKVNLPLCGKHWKALFSGLAETCPRSAASSVCSGFSVYLAVACSSQCHSIQVNGMLQNNHKSVLCRLTKKRGKVYLLWCQFLTEILAASPSPKYHSSITSSLICLMLGMVSKIPQIFSKRLKLLWYRIVLLWLLKKMGDKRRFL